MEELAGAGALGVREFEFVHSESYKRAQHEYEVAAGTHDPNAIVGVLQFVSHNWARHTRCQGSLCPWNAVRHGVTTFAVRRTRTTSTR